MKIVCALLLTALTLWSVTSGVALAAVAEQPAEAVETFDIWEYQVEGNTMLPQEDVERAVYGHLGEGKSIADVNDAQKQLETLYHERGFGSVLVDVPEQDVQNGVVKLKVTEGRVGRMQVTGSRYFSLGRIKSKLPSLASGEVPNLSQVQKELATLAQMSRDRTITPVLKPSRTPGKLDVELKVKDTLPLHGSLELNDRYSADTTHLRLNAALHYDNLWQREHSIGIAYQVSPEASDEVEVYSANYLWRFEDSDHLLALYGVKSNTNVATIGTLGVIGSGVIGGARYIVPLTAFDGVYHSLSLGADYKDFDEQIGFDQGGTVVTPISYLKFSAAYSGTYAWHQQLSHVEAVFNLGPDGLGNTHKEFERKRFKAKPSFAYLQVTADNLTPLPAGAALFARVSGQVSGDPLITNEQFSVGGVDDVRGYLEAERLGDNAVASTLELRSMNLARHYPKQLRNLELVAFTDAAALRTLSPLPGSKKSAMLWSTGLGVRVEAAKHLEAALMWAYPLRAGDRTPSGDQRVHFNLGVEF
ncbi:MAG: ShlB/FhaC/HecB family hemolysin secretion/activation protein [Proteobacteria bacterium]|nr:ShlB/FhaC/HecB family hemolysin secretion/activation protein [Pseudomonadota bacterium]